MLDCLNFFFVVLFPEVGPYGYKFPLMNRTAFAVSDRFWNTLSIFNCLKVFFYLGFPCGSDSKESACNVGDPGLITGSRRLPGGAYDNPLQYSCLENPMDRGAWRSTFHGSQRVRHNWATNAFSSHKNWTIDSCNSVNEPQRCWKKRFTWKTASWIIRFIWSSRTGKTNLWLGSDISLLEQQLPLAKGN